MKLQPHQAEHEKAIDHAYRKLLEPGSDKALYWAVMVSGIKSRDPEVTAQLEAERLARVGL